MPDEPAAASVTVTPGRPLPLGVDDCCDGFNFAVFSRHAERIELLIFEDAASAVPLCVFDLDPTHHRTGDIWHALLDGVQWGQAYAYRVHGPWSPEDGQRFDGKALLLDPYALAIATPEPGNGRCLLVNRRFAWQGTSRPRRPWSETVIYETHVRGLTIDPSANSAHPGTFLGIIDKIPYFRDLGVTALELMPVQEFDERIPLSRDTPLRNYWGYNPVAFFAPHRGYAVATGAGSLADEFKTMVRALHRTGIEIILDVVFNHTAEGNASGPLFNFRGLDNAIYYLLSEDKREYQNFSGCGNTVNCNHPVVRDYIIDCLRYWATEMQVDGFRFDLASILGRDEEGRLAANPPLLESIAENPILRDVKLIAEAWDAGGAYQVGSFPGQRWAEWNGRFRDDVRRFWRGDAGMTGALASRLCGSADLYQKSGKEPVNSVNFVACHDGFTLADAVSYAGKHNEANGEDNRDGAAENFSANYGIEGPTDDPEIERTRLRQIKNMTATLLLSRGVPMILGGDEFRRTQLGNNNAYCQDNEVSWYDWRLAEHNRELLRFVRSLIEFRKHHPVLRAETFYSEKDLRWFGPGGRLPDWDGPTRALGCLVRPPMREAVNAGALCLLFNAGETPAEFLLPGTPAGPWRISIDTGNPAPDDVFRIESEPWAPDPGQYRVGSRALAVLSLA
jgi:glycogen operon protein